MSTTFLSTKERKKKRKNLKTLKDGKVTSGFVLNLLEFAVRQNTVNVDV